MAFRLRPVSDASEDFRPLALLVGSAMFMEQLDATIISPVIPQIALQYGIDPLGLNLTMTIYLLCSLIFIPLSGLFAARWGSRTTFCGSVLLFVISSVLCAMSTSVEALAASRGLQGAAAAMMVPVGRNVLIHAVGKGKLVQALAWMVTPAMLGPMLGPPLGGILGTYLSWHWVFWANVPVGLAGLWAARYVMPELRTRISSVFDWGEWLLLSAILALIVIGVESVRQADDPLWLFAWVLALTGLLVFYIHYRRHLAHPMLDFSLLQGKSFSAGFWGGSLVRVGYGALPFLLPLMLQLGLGFSAVQSGMVLLLSGTVAFFAKTQTAKMLGRWGFRRMLIGNGLMCTAGLLACACFALPGWNMIAISLVMALTGFFRAIQFNALSAIAYADLPAEKVASATTLNTMAWQLAVTVGIAFSALLIEWSATWASRAEPASADYAIAFGLLALCCAAAIPCYRSLPEHAGQELSGHTPRVS
ncbi:High-copy suppressor of rspA [Bordetella tumbae]|uniref:MFS transporter n=1 Tax=Bordetella tumbae TaxID=1649139 RepID=UPI0039EEAA6F